MNKRIKKKNSKKVDQIIQELNVLGVVMGRKNMNGPFWRPKSLPDIDKKAIRRITKHLSKDPVLTLFN